MSKTANNRTPSLGMFVTSLFEQATPNGLELILMPLDNCFYLIHLHPKKALIWRHFLLRFKPEFCFSITIGEASQAKEQNELNFGSAYSSLDDESFLAKYRARCHCGAVRYEVRADPVDAKVCHCRDCQVLHGAPMQWAAIFRKGDVRFTAGVEHLRFYNSVLNRDERLVPCKVACTLCGTLIADEGRNMWLAFPTLFDFGAPPQVPEAFKPSCHIFYGMRVMDIIDELPKWSGHKDKSTLL